VGRGGGAFVQNVLGGDRLSFASALAGACGLFWPNAPPPLLASSLVKNFCCDDGKPSAGVGLGRNNPQAVTQFALRSHRSPPAEDVSAEFTARAPRSHEPAPTALTESGS
jgi:hypothetical protein